jgi:glycosyl transferase family 25
VRAFIINLDSASDRWSFIQERFADTGVPIERVPAENGAALHLPHPDYAEPQFHWYHGRATNLMEIGCYQSHVKAMKAFLTTNDSHGLICEDDIRPNADLAQVLENALRYAAHWNVLRVSGLGEGTPLKVADLGPAYRLYVSLGRLKGAGAYVVDRAAAEAFVEHLLPMWLPFDHAVDREWAFGLRAAYVLPFPCCQTARDFQSSIQKGRTGKRPSSRRWVSTYPYQARNEVARWLFRGASFLRMKCASPAARNSHAA